MMYVMKQKLEKEVNTAKPPSHEYKRPGDRFTTEINLKGE